VGDLEQRIDIVKIDLPEPENLRLFRMRGMDVDVCPQGAEQEIVVALDKSD
jgi:hypothetical protein